MRITLVAYDEGFHCLTTARVHIEKQGISLLPTVASGDRINMECMD